MASNGGRPRGRNPSIMVSSSSRSSSIKRRSLSRKKSSGSHRSSEISPLDDPDLKELERAAGGPDSGLTPRELAGWITAKGEEFGSVYLINFVPKGEADEVAEAAIAYRYKVVESTTANAGKHFLTLSSFGVNEFFMGDVRFVDLKAWVGEFTNYEKLRSIAFFKRFKKTKSFQTWKCVIKRQKFTSASLRMKESSCIFGNMKMRHCFMQVQSLVGKLTDMGVTEILPRKTYDLNDFFARQLSLVSDFATNFGDFRNVVCNLVLDTCKATFTDAGFNYDDYATELAYTQRQIERQLSASRRGSTASTSEASSMSSSERPRKMTFIEQVNKRKVCEVLVRFIRLIDFMLRFTVHKIVTNSLIAIQKALVSRAKSRPTPEALAAAALTSQKDKKKTKEDEEALAASAAVDADQEIPVFSCKVSVVEKVIQITPDHKVFDEGFLDLLGKLNEAVQSVPILFNDSAFNPFTQPILYGKIEDYKTSSEAADGSVSGSGGPAGAGGVGAGPGGGGTGPFIAGHETECLAVLEEINLAMREAFEVCDLEMEPYKATAREFCEVDREGDDQSKLVDVQTDVDSLKSKLSNLTEQQSLAKGIKDTQNMSIFRADFRPLKRTILPNISKTIIRLQDALPKLGREKMEHFHEECKSLKDMIEFELKTTEDFVDNMDIKEKLQDKLALLKGKLEGIENVYLIMKNIPVPVSTEDKNSLKNLKSQLKSLNAKVQDKIRAHADILDRFAETLEQEQTYLKDTVFSILQEVRSPALLELEATADEVKPTLAKIEVMLKQASAKVLQYNQYEKTYGFHISEYLELVAADKMLAATKTVWKCTEDWEVMYSKWASVEFSHLDVDDCEEGTAMIELELEEAREVLGASPMSQDLMEKVNATTKRLPVLKDLRTEALKERHWKQISEIVGADLSTSGKKITMEVLDKYNVFDFGTEIARIVKTATQEEQLDCMINDLKNTWTERKPTIKMMHGIPTVSDFNMLYGTISSSLVTLKELGQSRYSSEMKDSLLYWCDIVEKADMFVGVLREAQTLWMYQEVPMTSMLIQDEHPSKYAYFKLLRSKFEAKMARVAEAPTLISAFSNVQHYEQLIDILQGFKESERLMRSVLWSLRADSPRLFFLTRSDLLHMLFLSHNDLPALHQYIEKIFPAISSLVLVENTDLTVTERGYHPEIKGIMSRDGESMTFSEVMKARLGVEHWVKCIGLHLKATLREMGRKYPHDEVVSLEDIKGKWTKMHDYATHVQVVAIHSSMCKYLAAHPEDPLASSPLKAAINDMHTFSVENIKSHGLNRIRKNREIVKLLMLEYYADLMHKTKTNHELLESFLVRYTWEKERRIFRVSQLDEASVPFGYEYNGQATLFNPSMAFDRVAYNVLANVCQSDICILDKGVRKKLLRSLCYMFGRHFVFVSSSAQENFAEALVGGIITNTWLYIQGEDQPLKSLTFLRELAIKAEMARKFSEEYLDVVGQEVDLGSNVNIIVSKVSLLGEMRGRDAESAVRSTLLAKFRQISLTKLSVGARIRLALLSRGVSDRGLALFLCSVMEKFMEIDVEQPQCLEIKMINAICMSINTSKAGLLQKFLKQGLDVEVMRIKMTIDKLVLDDDVYDIIKRHAKMTEDFRHYFEDFRNPSMAAASASITMVENCIALQTSVSNFAMTCVVYPNSTNTIRRSLRAALSFLHNQTGCMIYEVCAKTQIEDGKTMQRILTEAKDRTGVLHVYGHVPAHLMSWLRTIAMEFSTLKVLFSCNDKAILNQLQAYINCVIITTDTKYDMLTAIALTLTEKIFGIVEKHFEAIFPVLEAGLHVLQETLTNDDSMHFQLVASERSYTIAVGKAFVSATNSIEIGSMLSNAQLVKSVLHLSILAAFELFAAPGTEAYEKAVAKFREAAPLNEDVFKNDPALGDVSIVKIPRLATTPDLESEHLAAQVRILDGQADIFIPTRTLVEAIRQVHFFLHSHTSVLLVGERGCGKSLILNKVIPTLARGTSVKYLIMGNTRISEVTGQEVPESFEYEISTLQQMSDLRSNIVVVENFDPNSEVHCHFISSLMTGRSFYDERKGKFERLPNLKLFVEVSCKASELPNKSAFQQMAIMHIAKDSEADQEIITHLFAAFSDDLETAEMRACLSEVVDFLTSWHVKAKAEHPDIINDHTLYRTVCGILAFVPEEIVSRREFLQHVYNETIEEYAALLPALVASKYAEDMRKQYSLFSVLTGRADGESGSSGGGVVNNQMLVSYYQMESSNNVVGGGGAIVRLQTMQETIKKLTHSYHFIRGKSFNDRLVFSSHYTKQVLSVLRAFCRYGNVTLVGPTGCGKRSTVSFVSHYLDLDMVRCSGNVKDMFATLKEAYTLASEETPKLLYIDVSPDDAEDIFNLLDKIFFYYDIPDAFSKTDKLSQLFEDQTARFEAVLNPTLLVDATRDLTFRIKDYFHVVVAMTPDVFYSVYAHHCNFFTKSATVQMTDWSEETLIAVAEERFAGLEQDLNIPVRNVSKTCAILHRQMTEDPMREVSSTQYLDMVKVLPQLYKPLQKKLVKIKTNLQTGIDQVHKANTFINKLTNEISEKEPEVLRLNSEIEQLNKRLSQERMNLERASKAFRKKEVAARKKSEDTQELAADAHRNLEHALPSLEAAMQAVSTIEKAELLELRTMKTPPEIAVQVMEAVCILMSLKPDWATAKVLLGDAAFTQKLADFDKDNIPEATTKRIRRYIDSPKFIPDEVAKVSKVACSMCMWVRAIDLYAKIFKSIEPKRIRLLQAESELAEAMAALREETDRVAHIEATITSIQSSYQERVKRKASLEASIKQTSDRLERAQLLSYSLEEESERWRKTLIEVDKSLTVLVGNSVVAAMIVAYAGSLRQDERRLMVEKWRGICDRSKLETTVIPANDFVSTTFSPLKHWIGKFEFYAQNYLSLRYTHKWSCIHDTHGLGFEAMKAQNDNIVIVGMHEDRLGDTLKQAILKGHEVMVTQFNPRRIPAGIEDVFHKKMSERVHAFVGLMGIPIMRKDFRVILQGQEVVVNPKFRLILHSYVLKDHEIVGLKKMFNVVNFEYSSEALDHILLRKALVKVDPDLCSRYEDHLMNIRHLENAIVERKDNVLDILLKSEEDVLDDRGVIAALKDAKAKVFEIMNDLTQEKKEISILEESIPKYRASAQKLKSFTKLLELLSKSDSSCPMPTKLLELLSKSDSSCPMPKTGFIKLLDSMEVCPDVDGLLTTAFDKVLKEVLPSLRSRNRYVLQMGCNVIAETEAKIELYSSLEGLFKALFDLSRIDTDTDKAGSKKFKEGLASALEEYFKSDHENPKDEEDVVRSNIEAMEINDDNVFRNVFEAEQSLVSHLSSVSSNRPVLLFHDDSNAVDAVEVIVDMAVAGGFKSPQYCIMDDKDPADIAVLIGNSRKERRWLIIDNFHLLFKEDTFSPESLPAVSPVFRLFFLTRHDDMPKCFSLHGLVFAVSLSHSAIRSVRAALFLYLLCLRSPKQPVDAKTRIFYEGILRLHQYLVEDDPSFGDIFRHVSTLATKWRNVTEAVTPQKVASLVAEAYGQTMEDQTLLVSILRELTSAASL